MKVENTRLKDVFIITPEIFGDDRGFFLESWNSKNFKSAGLDFNFVQDNTSRSNKGGLRGLHFQLNQPQGKLVKVSKGEVFDVAVDLRRSSPSFGQWFGITLNDINHKMLFGTSLSIFDQRFIITGKILETVLKQENINVSFGKSKFFLLNFFSDNCLFFSLG